MILFLSFAFVSLIKMELFAVVRKTGSYFRNNCFLFPILFFFLFLIFKSRDIQAGDRKAEFFIRA